MLFRKIFLWMQKHFVIVLIIVIVALLVVYPYLKVEILTALHSSDFENHELLYLSGEIIYDLKVFSYGGDKATVFYVMGDCMWGIMVDFQYDKTLEKWVEVGNTAMWSQAGGNAQEFYWPPYYWKYLF